MLILASDPAHKGLKITPVPHIVTECECGAPIVYLTSRKGHAVPVAPEVARGCTAYHGNLTSHYLSCPAYLEPTGRSRIKQVPKPMPKTVAPDHKHDGEFHPACIACNPYRTNENAPW